jgi:uncharacterized protein (DUF1697 family)
MTTFVALIRGINVGGRTIPMKELKELYEALGLKDVVTYIQSGNVVFSSDEEDAAQLTQRIEDSFAERFGFRAKAMLRSAAEFSEIIARNPFNNQPDKETKWIVVMFMAGHPGSAALEDLHKKYSGPEEFYLVGQELYIYYPNGIGRSKLTGALIEKTLKTAGTARNWNTVLQLQKMMQRQDPASNEE